MFLVNIDSAAGVFATEWIFSFPEAEFVVLRRIRATVVGCP